MNIDTEAVLNEVIDKMRDILKIRANDIPNIELYMDQVTTFMDEKLRYTVRTGESEEKILTKTMINNYAKNDLLPPPYKKKYSREHMMVLIFVYYFKSFLTINDIQILLQPLTDTYFSNESGLGLDEIYDAIFDMGAERMQTLENNLRDSFSWISNSFEEVPQEEAEYLRLFTYICFLSYDIFVKKMLIEQLIDELSEKQKERETEEKKKDKKKKS
ncbi:MAG: DUF1836 domain-containing protein [Lachnospiraceae bacterium]|nr:DUF1836 domain-containing protein [Lachnospiraceae bacterium]